jgi:hypothetical protein
MMVSLWIVLVSVWALSVQALQLRQNSLVKLPTTTSFRGKMALSVTGSSSGSQSSSPAGTSKYLGKSPIFVAGGSRGAGYELIKQLSRMGTPVHALIRSQESYAPLSSLPGVTVSIGNALDEVAVRKSMDGCVAAVTMLGGRSGDHKPDSDGNCNVIEQAGILGVERVILTTR